MTVDLNTCLAGDILVSKHGMLLVYKGKMPPGSYHEHEVLYIDGSRGSRMSDGYVYKNQRLPEDHDIESIVHYRSDRDEWELLDHYMLLTDLRTRFKPNFDGKFSKEYVLWLENYILDSEEL